MMQSSIEEINLYIAFIRGNYMSVKSRALKKQVEQDLHYTKNDQAIDKKDSKATLPIYLECLKPSWKYVVLDFFVILLDAIFEIMIPYLCGLLIRQGLQPLNMNAVWLYGGLMIGMALLAILFQAIGMKLSAIISSDYIERLRNTIFWKAEQFSFSNIGHFPVSKMTTMLSNDCNNIRFFVLMLVRMGFKQTILVVACFVFIFSLNWAIGLITLPLSLIAFFVICLIILKTRPQFIMTQTALDNVNRNVEEDTEGIREVKAFCREEHMEKKFGRANEDLTEISYSAVSKMGMTSAITTLAINVTIGLIQYFGGFEILNTVDQTSNSIWMMMNYGQPFDAGELSMLSSFAAVLTVAFSFISMLVQFYGRAEASKERIDRVLSEEIDISYQPKPKTDDFDPDFLKDGHIFFDHVIFSYIKDPAKAAIGPVSIDIRSGETLGIIGGTGSGKSSFVNLIPRLYDTTAGTVSISGHNVKDYSVTALRNDIGVVLQNNILFTGTIRSNILWGKKDATDEEIWDALEIAQAAEFVRGFPEGLDTPVAQGGKSVSGGQKQRLCIARAVIKKPKILILDDSVSACDMDTARKIQEQFSTRLKDTTVLVIAQRIDSVQNCDRILVLDNGKPVGLGTHSDLLRNCPIYREIDAIQRKGVD